jgi:hypothetical protein
MVSFIGRDHEKSVARVDAVALQPAEKFTEGLVVGLELSHVTSLARAKGVTGSVVVMSVRERKLR